MDAGALNKRITIQKPTKQRASSGQQIPGWEDVCTIWADVKCTDSKTVDNDGVIRHEGLYRFYIRWRPNITAEMRVKWKDRIFELTGPPADWKSERSGLTLIAKELI